MYLYCQTWNFEDNPFKTKITIFCNRRFDHNFFFFTYNNQVLDIVDNLVYLGTLFSSNGRFLQNYRRMAARKAMFSVLGKSRNLHLPVDLKLQLFDSMVVPILLYGSEVTNRF